MAVYLILLKKSNNKVCFMYDNNVALKITQLSKTYPNGFCALKGVNLTVQKGDFFALLGANGAGKSTMIGIISSLLKMDKGVVEIFGVDIVKKPNLAKSYLGVVPQEFNFNQFEECLNVLLLQAGYHGIAKKDAIPHAEFLLKSLGLWEKRHTKTRALSGGMKRRLMIARALIHKPKLLILDEPTAGVDIELRRSMWEFIKKINEEGTTIILTTHYLEEAEQLCKNIAIVNHGEVLIHTQMKDLLSQLSNQEFIFDLKDELPNLPNFKYALNAYQIDNKTLEITLGKHQELSQLFVEFNQHNIQIKSMRNKSNRLEEIFMNIVDKDISKNKEN